MWAVSAIRFLMSSKQVWTVLAPLKCVDELFEAKKHYSPTQKSHTSYVAYKFEIKIIKNSLSNFTNKSCPFHISLVKVYLS